MARELTLIVDIAESRRMIPEAILAVEDGLLSPDEALELLGRAARVVYEDGHSVSIGELLDR